ncbi:hypothetical protein B1J93_11385 [Leptospira kirschneri serovar Pomona]|uniref:Uncharacterized protein n=1 Tax=Leptospira kirschneri serovar Pomona TaxID=561005 RepID=A0A1T1DMV9_9LEPT|nr:hypothetical protein B1J93_11385 [Leptospira kirschneri serovar Pomona]
MWGNSGSLWIAFYVESKDNCCIMFSVCNLLTRAKESVRLPMASWIRLVYCSCYLRFFEMFFILENVYIDDDRF